MTRQANLKCLRCDCEYSANVPDKPEQEERTCPRCRSNSVRILPDKKADAK